MSTILDALNKYKKEKERRANNRERSARERELDGDGGGGGSSNPPPAPPGGGGNKNDDDERRFRRQIVYIVALVGTFLVLIVIAGVFLLYLINQQNTLIAQATYDARVARQKSDEAAAEIKQAAKDEETPKPAVEPTPVPTSEPTPAPTVEPTPKPTPVPTVEPTPSLTPIPGELIESSDGMFGAAVRRVDADELEISLEGIMWDSVEPATLIDGRIYYVGDKIKGYKVLKINKDSIEVTKGSLIFKVVY